MVFCESRRLGSTLPLRRAVPESDGLMLVDDVFASIGSANFFSHSTVGTDSELSCTFVTTGPSVINLRVRLWAEHLRTPPNEQVVPALEDLDTAGVVPEPDDQVMRRSRLGRHALHQERQVRDGSKLRHPTRFLQPA
jgi:hypothetical protein